MDLSKSLSPNPTELIDWLAAEGLLDLDWDFPEDGDLLEAGLDTVDMAHLAEAIHDEYDVEIAAEDLTPEKISTPKRLAALIASRGT